MTEKERTTGENRIPFDLASFMVMMEDMMGNMECGCDCSQMMSQMASHAGSGSCVDTMSQKMKACCGVEGETKGPTAPEAAGS